MIFFQKELLAEGDRVDSDDKRVSTVNIQAAPAVQPISIAEVEPPQEAQVKKELTTKIAAPVERSVNIAPVVQSANIAPAVRSLGIAPAPLSQQADKKKLARLVKELLKLVSKLYIIQSIPSIFPKFLHHE